MKNDDCICNDGFGMNLSCPIHGPKDIPEDFKEGMRDIAEGNTVDLDHALREPFPE